MKKMRPPQANSPTRRVFARWVLYYTWLLAVIVEMPLLGRMGNSLGAKGGIRNRRTLGRVRSANSITSLPYLPIRTAESDRRLFEMPHRINAGCLLKFAFLIARGAKRVEIRALGF